MRVLSISTLFPAPHRRAFGTFVGSQMQALAARGTVDLVMVNPLGVPPWPLSLAGPFAAHKGWARQSELGGLTVHHPRFTLIPRIGGDSNPARIARAVLPLARCWHAQQPFDLVDAQFLFPDGPAAALIARDLGLPLTIKARGSDVSYWGQRPRALAQIRAAADDASAILSVSQALIGDMAALGLPAGKMVAHYTGLDHQRFAVLPRAEARARLAQAGVLAVPAAAPLLVCAGYLIERKGQALVIEALRALPGAQLALAGKGPDEAALRAAAADLQGRVHFLGEIGHDVLPVLMAAADALVQPSVSEGLANVWVEALACGTPLVIPPIGGAGEVVTGPAAGRIAAREAGAIAAALADLLAAPPAQADTAAFAARFSWQANAENLEAIWRAAAGRRA